MKPALQLPSFDPHRRWLIGLNVSVTVGLLLAILLMGNYLAARLARRFDWSGSNRFSISPLTEQVLKGLTSPIKVTVLFDPGAEESRTRLLGMVEDLLGEYAHRSSRLELRFVDGLRQAQVANAVKAQFNLAAETDDVVVFEAGTRFRTVYFNDLSIYEGVGDFLRTREVRRSGFKGEERFTSAIMSVLETNRPKVCYLQGHREHRLDSDDEVLGYERFSRILSEKDLDVSTITLASQNENIPPSCRLLIIAGPQTPPLAEEVAKIEAFLKVGGRLLLLTNPLNLKRGEVTGFETLLGRWGVYVGRQVARDRVNTLTKTDVLSRNFSAHAVTAHLNRTDGYVYFPEPRVVRRLPDSLRPPEAPRGENLVTTSTNGFTLSDFRNHTWYESPQLDLRGEIPMGVAVEQGGLAGITANRGATRLIVLGDSSMFGNDAITKGSNRDFASLILEWLLDRPQFLAIGPKAVWEYRLNLTARQIRALKLALIGGLPGSVLLLGVVVWLQRRR